MSRESEFFQRYWPAAVKATQGTNVSPYMLLGQFAQETGYGEKIRGNNPMNLTAGSKWTGPTMVRGDATLTDPSRQQKFRSYGSIDEGLADYVKLMQSNPRYAGTLKGTMGERSAALGTSGYAEDKTYGPKVGELASRFEAMRGSSGSAYNVPDAGAPRPAAGANGIPGGIDPKDLPWGGVQAQPGTGGNLAGAMKTAVAYQGMNETANRAALGEFMAQNGVPFTPQNVAWCARFVNSSLAANGMPGTGSNMARSFMTWGQATSAPKEGDIAVFSRGDPKSPQGHVGFYGGTVDRDGQQYIRVFGGNQGGPEKGGGEAGWSEIPASRLLGYRTSGGEGGAAAAPAAPAPAPPAGVLPPPGVAGPSPVQTPPAAPVAPFSVAPNSDAARMMSDPTRYGLDPAQAQAMREQVAAGQPGGGTIGNIPAPQSPAPQLAPPPPAGVLPPPANPDEQGNAVTAMADWQKKRPLGVFQGGWT